MSENPKVGNTEEKQQSSKVEEKQQLHRKDGKCKYCATEQVFKGSRVIKKHVKTDAQDKGWANETPGKNEIQSFLYAHCKNCGISQEVLIGVEQVKTAATT